MEETPIAIDIQNLSKHYSKKADAANALNDVTFQVPVGKVCCLLGPNGSGKTTLLKICAGLVAPTSGAVSIMGHDIQKEPRAAKSKIGWMPAEERSGFYGRITAMQNLKFFGILHDLDKEPLDRVIGNLALQMDLKSEMDQVMQKMSAGTRQKIGLMRALLHNPAVLLLDEPMRSLDPHAIVRFRRLIKDHLTRNQKKTVLLSTHLLEEARRVADIIIIISEGRIIRKLESDDLEKELRHASLEDFYIKTVDAGASA